MNRRQRSITALVAALWSLAAVSCAGMKDHSPWSVLEPPSNRRLVPRVLGNTKWKNFDLLLTVSLADKRMFICYRLRDFHSFQTRVCE